MRFSRLLSVCGLIMALCCPVLASSQAEAREIKVGHGYPNTHPMHLALVQFSDEVKEKTKGDLVFTIVPSGVLGGEGEMIQQLLGGMLEATYISGINAFQSYVPQASVEDLPFLFKDAQAAYDAFDGPFGKRIAEHYLEPLGFKVVTYIEHGFRQITNNKRPIVRPDDLKGLKLRVPPLELRIEEFKLLGANPVPVALPELFSALQQNTVDGQENPIATIDSFKFYEVQKYLSLVNHTHTTGLLLIHKAVWGKFTPEQQAIILAAGESAKKASREMAVKYEVEAVARIKASSNMQVNEADYASFAEQVKPMWDTFVKKNGSDLLDLLK